MTTKEAAIERVAAGELRGEIFRQAGILGTISYGAVALMWAWLG